MGKWVIVSQIFFFIKSASHVIFSKSKVFLPSLLHFQLQFVQTDNVKWECYCEIDEEEEFWNLLFSCNWRLHCGTLLALFGVILLCFSMTFNLNQFKAILHWFFSLQPLYIMRKKIFADCDPRTKSILLTPVVSVGAEGLHVNEKHRRC